MKLSEFRPGKRVCAGDTGSSLIHISDGILLKTISIASYIDGNKKIRYYIKCCIMKKNGKESWWPLSMVNYVRKH